MTKALKKRPKGEVIEELQGLIDRAKAWLSARPADAAALAEQAIERLTWHFEVMLVLPHMSKGIQVAADLARTVAPGQIALCHSIPEEIESHQRLVKAQTELLQTALDRWKRSNTRPLS